MTIAETPHVVEVGIYHDLPADDYFKIEALSSSGAGKILKSPAHYLCRDLDEDTKEKTRGTAAHAAILQWEVFKQTYEGGPDVDLRTKDGKARWADCLSENPGKIVLRFNEWPLVCAIREAVWAHPIARKLLECSGPTEASFVWTYAGTGYPMKARTDKLASEVRTIVDLKCLRDIRPDEFCKAMYARGYHRQGATYQHAAAAHGLSFDKTAFIAVENEPPHCVIVYELDDEALEAGWSDMRLAAEIYAECMRSGDWPGFKNEIHKASLPRWAKGREDLILSI